MSTPDNSMNSASAYELHALEFLDARERSTIGAGIVAHWASKLPVGADVIEIGCGGGYPVTRVLVQTGLHLWAIDSSPTLLAKFRLRFPSIPTQCALALESDYFERKFGAAIAIGLLFLLEESEQVALLHRVSEVLLPDGRFLFTAPLEIGAWQDTTTGHECRALGRARYEQALEDAGLGIIGTYVDEGGNNHYEVQKLSRVATRRAEQFRPREL